MTGHRHTYAYACVRWAPGEEPIIEYRKPGLEVEAWLEVRRRREPLSALFIDGQCVQPGPYESLQAAEAAYATRKIKIRRPL